jgi:tetratricopeptide (TPR) repeat protein
MNTWKAAFPLALITVLIASIQPAAGGPGARTTARLAAVSGNVYVLHAGKNEWTPARAGEAVSPDTLLKTGPASELRLESGKSGIVIGPDSIVRAGDLLKGEGATRYLRFAGIQSKFFPRFAAAVKARPPASPGTQAKNLRGAAGFKWLSGEKESAEEHRRSDSLNIADACYADKKYSQVIYVLEPRMDSLKGVEKSEALFLLGASYFFTGNFPKSAVCIRDMLDMRETDNTRRSIALFMISLALHYRGDYVESIRYLEQFIKEFPSDENVPEAYYLAGVMHKMRGNRDEARSCFSHIIKHYPQSTLIPDSKAEMSALN